MLWAQLLWCELYDMKNTHTHTTNWRKPHCLQVGTPLVRACIGLASCAWLGLSDNHSLKHFTKSNQLTGTLFLSGWHSACEGAFWLPHDSHRVPGLVRQTTKVWLKTIIMIIITGWEWSWVRVTWAPVLAGWDSALFAPAPVLGLCFFVTVTGLSGFHTTRIACVAWSVRQLKSNKQELFWCSELSFCGVGCMT